MVKVYRAHEPSLTLFPEVRKILPELSSRFKLGLVSDGYLEVQQKKWAALGLDRYFEAVIFSDTWGRACWKPDHLPYIEAMAKCDIHAAATIYVGDNPLKDFLGANELGMGTVMVRRPAGVYSGDRPPSAAHAPDAEIVNLSGLLELIDEA
jgi:putative hydrolase of the HAD superfamily